MSSYKNALNNCFIEQFTFKNHLMVSLTKFCYRFFQFSTTLSWNYIDCCGKNTKRIWLYIWGEYEWLRGWVSSNSMWIRLWRDIKLKWNTNIVFKIEMKSMLEFYRFSFFITSTEPSPLALLFTRSLSLCIRFHLKTIHPCIVCLS